MKKEGIRFVHSTRGNERPQIVMVGNGLEYESGQPSWEALIKALKAPDCIALPEKELKSVPFPLQYQLLSTDIPGKTHLSAEDIKLEERRLATAVKELTNRSNALLDILPSLGADHIFTTNYSYCIEKAFYPKLDFTNMWTRGSYRFNQNPKRKDGVPIREIYYRMHSGYRALNQNGSQVGLWHIHGERSVPQGIVVGHDRYGRLLSRMESICDSQKYEGKPTETNRRIFTSWPELFLYGDVYVIGLGFYLCEYDLWWLLRRKQRERFADGRVYFYDNSNKEEHIIRDHILQAHGVIINPDGLTKEKDYNAFYEKALKDIQKRIGERKSSGR